MQKWTDVPWPLVLLPSLSCSLSPAAQHISLRLESLAPRSDVLLLLATVVAVLRAASGFMVCCSPELFYSLVLFGVFFLIAIIKRYNKQLFTDTWVVSVPAQDILITPRAGEWPHSCEWVSGSQELSSPNASCWKHSIPLHLPGLLSWRPTGHMSEKNVPWLVCTILLPSGSGQTVHPIREKLYLLLVCPS